MKVWSPLAARATEARSLARRRGSLRGLRIGILDNSKPNADVLLQRVAALLAEQQGAASVRSWQKPGSSKPALMIEEIADQSADTPVPWCPTPEDVTVIVAGGPGKHSSIVPTFGATRSVTVRVDG